MPLASGSVRLKAHPWFRNQAGGENGRDGIGNLPYRPGYQAMARTMEFHHTSCNSVTGALNSPEAVLMASLSPPTLPI